MDRSTLVHSARFQTKPRNIRRYSCRVQLLGGFTGIVSGISLEFHCVICTRVPPSRRWVYLLVLVLCDRCHPLVCLLDVHGLVSPLAPKKA